MTTMTIDSSLGVVDVPTDTTASDATKTNYSRAINAEPSSIMPSNIRKPPSYKSKLQVSLSPDTIRLMEEEAAKQGISMNEFMSNAFSGVLAKNAEAKNIEVSKVASIKTTRVIAASEVYDQEGNIDKTATPIKAAFSIKVVGTPEMAKELTPFLHPHALEVKGRDENHKELPSYDAEALKSTPWSVGTAQVAELPEGTSCEVFEDGTIRVHMPNIMMPSSHYGTSILNTIERKIEGTVITRDEQVQSTSFDLQQRKIIKDENGDVLLITKEILRHTEEMHKVAARSAEVAAEAVRAAADAVKASSTARRSFFGIDIKELSLKNIGNFKSNNEAEKDTPDKTFMEKTKIAVGDAASKGLGYLAKAAVVVGLFTACIGAGHMVMPDTVQSPTVVASKLVDVGKGVFLKTANEGTAEFTMSKEGPVLKFSTTAEDDKAKDSKADKADVKSGTTHATGIDVAEAEIKASFFKAVSDFKAGDKVSEIRLNSMYSAVSDINMAHTLDGHKPLVDKKTMSDISELLSPATINSMDLGPR